MDKDEKAPPAKSGTTAAGSKSGRGGSATKKNAAAGKTAANRSKSQDSKSQKKSAGKTAPSRLSDLPDLEIPDQLTAAAGHSDKPPAIAAKPSENPPPIPGAGSSAGSSKDSQSKADAPRTSTSSAQSGAKKAGQKNKFSEAKSAAKPAPPPPPRKPSPPPQPSAAAAKPPPRPSPGAPPDLAVSPPHPPQPSAAAAKPPPRPAPGKAPELPAPAARQSPPPAPAPAQPPEGAAPGGAPRAARGPSLPTQGNTALALNPAFGEPQYGQPKSRPEDTYVPAPLDDRASDPEAPSKAPQAEAPQDQESGPKGGTRRTARRRPAGPPRSRIAANDDAPSIGGLIYALNQRPSKKPFVYAAAASGFWVVLALAFAFAFLPGNFGGGFTGIVANPWFPTLIATLAGPVALFGFLALLAWRAEELHLRSTAMTEVAVRLAEPDRMAEQSVASLGQAVRRQVSFMNDAVSRALGRAGELEALVHNEVSALEHSYEENERKIRGLISELASERHSLLNTGEHFESSLRKMSVEIPTLMSQLSDQQLKLTAIIDGAGQNLTQLESALATQTGRFENALGDKANQLETVLTDYTEVLGSTLGARTENMQTVLSGYTQALGTALDTRTDGMEKMLGGYTEALGTALGSRTQHLQAMLEDNRDAIDTNVGNLSKAVEKNTQIINETLTDSTQTLQTVFEEYALALDTTLANRAEALDSQLVERTKALDDAFNDRLRLFDESVLRSTMAIDSAVGENTKSLTNAMEVHARQLSDSIASQAAELDETLMNGINSVRSTSENISRQSIKAIEGLAGQSDLLRNVSENLLTQINSVTNRFENQGQAIMRSANALETTNSKIERSLVGRTEELNDTLERMSGKAAELSQVVEGYSSSLEGSLTGAEQRARRIAEEITRETEARSRSALDDLQRVKLEASRETDRALEELRHEFTTVSQEVTKRLGALTNQFSTATGAVREQAAAAARDLEHEQARLKQQLDRLPSATEETASQMRRALSDQLRALDQLSTLASRDNLPDVSNPAPPRQQLPAPEPQDQSPQMTSSGAPSNGRGLSSLTSTLAREISHRNTTTTGRHAPFREASISGSQAEPERPKPAQLRPAPQPRPAAPARPAAALAPTSRQPDNWSLGDLLARASESGDDEATTALGPPTQQSLTPAAGGAPATQADSGGTIDINALSRALDPATAATIWSRFQAGQRGFMVRSIYTPESRNLFDGIARRYRSDESFKALVDRFLSEYQNELTQADQGDASGNQSRQLVQSETGRVYLVLAHASGRLL